MVIFDLVKRVKTKIVMIIIKVRTISLSILSFYKYIRNNTN